MQLSLLHVGWLQPGMHGIHFRGMGRKTGLYPNIYCRIFTNPSSRHTPSMLKVGRIMSPEPVCELCVLGKTHDWGLHAHIAEHAKTVIGGGTDIRGWSASTVQFFHHVFKNQVNNTKFKGKVVH